jgi:YihY family inner membrane protein
MRLISPTLRHMLPKLLQVIDEARITMLAAGVAYFVFFSLLPLMVLLVAVGAHFLSQEEAMRRTQALIAEALPHQRELVTTVLTGVVAQRKGAGIASALALLWGSKNVFVSLSQAMNAIWQVPGRPWLAETLHAFAAAAMAGLLVGLAGSLTAALHAVMAHPLPLTGLRPEDLPGVVPLVAAIVPPGFTFLLLCALYAWLPNRQLRLGQVWLAAATATVAWEVTGVLFGFYLTHVARFSWVYGSLGGIVGLLMWLYVSASIVLAGVVLARALLETEA